MRTVEKGEYATRAGLARRLRATASGRGVPALGRLRLLVPAVAALALTLIAAPVASASTTQYAIGKRICKLPKPGHGSCFAMVRVVVKKGTPGARPFKLAAGAFGRPAVALGSAATIGPAGGLTPSDLATAYGVSSTATGTGQTVATVDAYNDPNIRSDLATFDTNYGLLTLATCSTTVTTSCLSVVNQTGGSTLPAADPNTGWSAEESLDVETIHSLCQKCKIILAEANDDSSANLATAEQTTATTLHATEITNSFGAAEGGFLNTTAERADFNHPGLVITASTGDDGYYDFDLLGGGSPSPYNQSNAPASFNTVTAIGGTSLYLGQNATRQSETVWNDNGPKDFWEQNFGIPLGAGGGGCSTLFTAQSWQTSLSVYPSTACGTKRLDADISAVADPLTGFDIYDTYNCGSACPPAGWNTIGGTSLASPLTASIFALAGGAQGVSYPALTLYGHLGTSSLYDVTVGGNGFCGGEGAAQCGDPNTLGAGILDCDYPATGTTPAVGDRACDALPGYDGPTGVGTPNGLGAFAKTGPTAKIAGPTSVAHGTTTHMWTATTTDPFPGGHVTSFTWNWGDGTANTVTTTGSAAHAYTTAASRTITLTVKDNYAATGTATYHVTVT